MLIFLSHVISITLLHSNCRTNTYKHLTTRQYLKISNFIIHLIAQLICTQQVMDVSEIFTSVVMGCV
ncbi:hypothetical protein T4A_13170, partial [Trichinella pseudospiralis]